MEAMYDIGDEHFCETPESTTDDSDDDPTYTALADTRSKLLNLSVTKKPKPRVIEETVDVIEIDESEHEEVDEKSFEEVQRLIGDGKIDKLKVEQCKVYLRKNGLRLTGNKSMLIDRIKEHLEIFNGGGEKKYPVSSFFMNCKGDACTGDVVLFEQNIYDMYNIASRSASGPLCGTRMVAGRIVKESYGAAKQQHTFTVEVLWSKGEKPLPPLHPLLIKGRNLYKLKTLRQKWEDEEERQRKLSEKHARGSLARSNREARIEEKEERKKLKANRVSKREPNRNQPEFHSTSVPKPSFQPQQPSVSDNLGSTQNQAIGPPNFGVSLQPSLLASNCLSRKSGIQPALFVDHDKVTREHQLKKGLVHDNYINQASQSFVGNRSSFYTSNQPHSHKQPFTGMNNNRPISPPRRQYHRHTSPSRQSYDEYYCPTSPPRRQFYNENYRPMSPSRRQFCNDNYPRPVSPSRRQFYNDNYHCPVSPSRRQNFVPKKPCHFYAQGKWCRFGESCKFSHHTRE